MYGLKEAKEKIMAVTKTGSASTFVTDKLVVVFDEHSEEDTFKKAVEPISLTSPGSVKLSSLLFEELCSLPKNSIYLSLDETIASPELAIKLLKSKSRFLLACEDDFWAKDDANKLSAIDGWGTVETASGRFIGSMATIAGVKPNKHNGARFSTKEKVGRYVNGYSFEFFKDGKPTAGAKQAAVPLKFGWDIDYRYRIDRVELLKSGDESLFYCFVLALRDEFGGGEE